jgi:hypothetical protein
MRKDSSSSNVHRLRVGGFPSIAVAGALITVETRNLAISAEMGRRFAETAAQLRLPNLAAYWSRGSHR